MSSAGEVELGERLEAIRFGGRRCASYQTMSAASEAEDKNIGSCQTNLKAEGIPDGTVVPVEYDQISTEGDSRKRAQPASGDTKNGAHHQDCAADTTSVLASALAVSGAATFSVGSCGFVWSSWDETNWLLPFQLGCAVWIFGCLLFVASLGVDRYQRLAKHGGLVCWKFLVSRWTISEVCQLVCQLLFLVGCSLAFGTEGQVLSHLAAINALFLTGSLFLLVDGLWAAILIGAAINGNKEVCASEDRISLVWNGIVAISFVYAGTLGGYGASPSVIRAGIFGWTIGSIASGVVPVRQLVLVKNSSSEKNVASEERDASQLTRPCSTLEIDV